jgi:hypothetical protein
MPGFLQFILASLWHGLLFAAAVLVAALAGKASGPPIADYLQIHESIPTAAIFFATLGVGGWLFDRFNPKRSRTIVYPYIWP